MVNSENSEEVISIAIRVAINLNGANRSVSNGRLIHLRAIKQKNTEIAASAIYTHRYNSIPVAKIECISHSRMQNHSRHSNDRRVPVSIDATRCVECLEPDSLCTRSVTLGQQLFLNDYYPKNVSKRIVAPWKKFVNASLGRSHIFSFFFP